MTRRNLDYLLEPLRPLREFDRAGILVPIFVLASGCFFAAPVLAVASGANRPEPSSAELGLESGVFPIAPSIFPKMSAQAASSGTLNSEAATSSPESIRPTVRDRAGAIDIEISVPPSVVVALAAGRSAGGFRPVPELGNSRVVQMSLLVAVDPGVDYRIEALEIRDEPIPAASASEKSAHADRTPSAELRIKPSAWSSPVAILDEGILRDVRYLRVGIRPVRESGRERLVLSRLRFSIVQAAPPALRAVRQAGDPFESVYDRSFVNDWRTKGSAGPQLGADRAISTNSHWLPPSSNFSVYKIPVTQAATYSIDHATLSAATDWNLAALDPRNVHLFNRGVEVPMSAIGESDGSFDTGDEFDFYGHPLTGENQAGVWQKGDWTDTNNYWLVVTSSPATRMATLSLPSGFGFPISSHFPSTLKFEQNLYPAFFVPSTDSDHWCWTNSRWLGTDSSIAVAHHALLLPDVASDSAFSCSLSYEVRGVSYSTSATNDHHVFTRLGATPLDEITFDDNAVVDRNLSFAQSLLGGVGTLTLDVTVEVTDPALRGLGSDAVATNWFSMIYSRNTSARSNSLLLTPISGNQKFKIDGFTSNSIQGYDVTSPDTPRLLGGVAIATDGGGTFSYTLADAVPAGGRSYLVSVPQALASSSFVRDAPSNLSALDPQWILVAPAAWLSSPIVQSYVAWRQSQGLSAAAVAIEDVYDEYSFGNFDPTALRDFLASLYGAWSPAHLANVLLLGDAEYDYKNYAGAVVSPGVPTYMVADPGLADGTFLPFALHGFDNFFGCLAGADDIPDVLVGRIPARSQVEAEAALTKIRNWESSTPSAPWLARTAFIADCETGFEATQDANAAYVGPAPPYSVEKLYLLSPPYNCSTFDANSNNINDVVELMNDGRGIVSYVGHGSFTQWSSLPLFTSPTDLNALTNSSMPSVVLNADCYTGAYYHSAVPVSMMDDFMKRPTGMAAGLAPGTFMFNFQEEDVSTPFYSAFFGPTRERNIGRLFLSTFVSLAATGDRRITQGIAAYGDPVSTYPQPVPAAPTGLALTASACRSITLGWTAPSGSGPYTYRIYRATSPSTTYSAIATSATTSWTDTALVYGTTYGWYVAALDANGYEGRASATVAATANPCAPATPIGLACTNPQLGGRLDLTWTASTEPEITAYRVHWGTASGSWPNTVDVGRVSSARLDGVPEGVPVFVTLTALNSFSLESVLSSEVTCTSSHEKGWNAPAMVQPILLSKGGLGETIVSWTLPALDIWGTPVAIDRCSVYRGTSLDFIPDRSDASADRASGYLLASGCIAGACTWPDTAVPDDAEYYVTCETIDRKESAIGMIVPRWPTGVVVNRNNIAKRYYAGWNPVTERMDGATGAITRYDLYFGSSSDFIPDVKTGSNLAGTTTGTFISHSPLPWGPTYFYKLLAVDGKGNHGPN